MNKVTVRHSGVSYGITFSYNMYLYISCWCHFNITCMAYISCYIICMGYISCYRTCMGYISRWCHLNITCMGYWPNSQISWFFKSDTVISNDTVQYFGRNEWFQECYLQQLWIPWVMTNSWRCTIFLLGASKFDQKIIFSAKWLNFANFRDSWSENCLS